MERLVPNTLTSTPNETYLQGLKSVSCPYLEYHPCLSTFRRWSTSRLPARMLSSIHTTMGDSQFIVSTFQLRTSLTSGLAMATSSPPRVTLLHFGRPWQRNLHQMTRSSLTRVSYSFYCPPSSSYWHLQTTNSTRRTKHWCWTSTRRQLTQFGLLEPPRSIFLWKEIRGVAPGRGHQSIAIWSI